MTPIPIIQIRSAFHAGAMNPALRSLVSQEGDCLSVSLCPHAWSRIARLGGRPLYELRHPRRANFVDACAVLIDPTLRDGLNSWAMDRGLAVVRKRFKAWQYDSEGEEWRYSIHDSYAQAQAQIVDELQGGPGGVSAVEPFNGLQPTAELCRLTGIHRHDTEAENLAIYVWAASELPSILGVDIHGVAWNEAYDPAGLSAPRIGLFSNTLRDFIVRPVDWGAIADKEQLPRPHKLRPLFGQGPSNKEEMSF